MPAMMNLFGNPVYWLGQLPVPFWVVLMGLLALLAVVITAGRWYMHRENGTQLSRETDEWLHRNT